MREHLRLVAPQLEGAQQQLGEIDHAGARTGRLVVRVQPDQLAAVGSPPSFSMLRAAALILVAS